MTLTRKTAISPPDFIYTMNVAKNSLLSQLNCVHIGNIKDYDSVANTCTVEIGYLRQYGDNNIIQYPVLQDIPLVVLGGGNGELTFPDPTGEDCILLINDRDIDLWFESGQITTPNTARLHDISDAIAIVGIRNLLNPLVDYDPTATTLRNSNTKIKLSDKIELSNTAQSMATIMQDLLTACANITVVQSTGVLSSSSATTFNNIKTRLGALLK